MCCQKRTADGTVGALENSVAVLSGTRNHGLQSPPSESLVELKKMLKHAEEAWGKLGDETSALGWVSLSQETRLKSDWQWKHAWQNKKEAGIIVQLQNL
ncbi:hypothetical protein A2U01_0013345 [Trifolium medium]|uniref:Uncharacterized protein n=1 Tax=Trifolium medium TaxID=97028 RepID=A0A392MXX5_9FABA|nr:hypothetical protein [Trifolium medium]